MVLQVEPYAVADVAGKLRTDYVFSFYDEKTIVEWLIGK